MPPIFLRMTVGQFALQAATGRPDHLLILKTPFNSSHRWQHDPQRFLK
jgi:hypothetical protein